MEEIEFRDMRDTARAFLLVNVDTGKEDPVVDKLLKLEEIREAHIVPGDWDIIAVIEVEKALVKPSSERITELVKDKVRKISGITHTVTLIPAVSKIKE